jgi:hypothetical protein
MRVDPAALAAPAFSRQPPLHWGCLFVLPAWLDAWGSVFAPGAGGCCYLVTQNEALLGVAPLVVEGQQACFFGDPEVCDYFDFAVVPGREEEFSRVLLGHLQECDVTDIDLSPVRPESLARTVFARLAGEMGHTVEEEAGAVSLELQLPPTWEAFLERLNGKQRHELRRKLRRLEEAAPWRFRAVTDPAAAAAAMEEFLTLFPLSRPDKAAFLTGERTLFFRRLAHHMARAGLFRLSFLDLDGVPAAAALCFDYQSTVYLYNSGYDPRFRDLSVGLLCKVLTIQDSIQRGRRTFDFLRGAEDYKQRLGGGVVPLYRCHIHLH